MRADGGGDVISWLGEWGRRLEAAGAAAVAFPFADIEGLSFLRGPSAFLPEVGTAVTRGVSISAALSHAGPSRGGRRIFAYQ